MKALCNCQKVLLVLGVREMDTNEQIWPQISGKDMSWADMKSALDQLMLQKLVIKNERKVEGNRVATFYTLPSEGQAQNTAILSGEERKDGSDSIFKNNCCLNQAA